MQLFVFARIHAQPSREKAILEALLEVQVPTRKEPGCVSVQVFQSIRDSQVFYIHTRWKDKAAFDNHVRQPYTVSFVERVEPLIDHTLDVTRTREIG
jgi:quinol monooxygenase YgiN